MSKGEDEAVRVGRDILVMMKPFTAMRDLYGVRSTSEVLCKINGVTPKHRYITMDYIKRRVQELDGFCVNIGDLADGSVPFEMWPYIQELFADTHSPSWSRSTKPELKNLRRLTMNTSGLLKSSTFLLKCVEYKYLDYASMHRDDYAEYRPDVKSLKLHHSKYEQDLPITIMNNVEHLHTECLLPGNINFNRDSNVKVFTVRNQLVSARSYRMASNTSTVPSLSEFNFVLYGDYHERSLSYWFYLFIRANDSITKTTLDVENFEANASMIEALKMYSFKQEDAKTWVR